MHRQDRTSPRRNGRFDPLRIDVVGPRIDVHEDRLGPHHADRLGGGHEGEGRGDHLVARADIQSAERQVQGVRPVGHADGEPATAIGGDLLLQGLDVGPRM